MDHIPDLQSLIVQWVKNLRRLVVPIAMECLILDRLKDESPGHTGQVIGDPAELLKLFAEDYRDDPALRFFLLQVADPPSATLVVWAMMTYQKNVSELDQTSPEFARESARFAADPSARYTCVRGLELLIERA